MPRSLTVDSPACVGGTVMIDPSCAQGQVPRCAKVAILKPGCHGLHHPDVRVEKRRKRGGSHRGSHGGNGKLIKAATAACRLVDTQGLLLHGIVTKTPTFTDGGGSRGMATPFGLFPFLGTITPTAPFFHRALAGILPDSRPRSFKRSDRVEGLRRPEALGGNAPSPGSTAAADWPRTGRPRNALAFIKLAPFDSCSENSVILHKVRLSGRTLRVRLEMNSRISSSCDSPCYTNLH